MLLKDFLGNLSLGLTRSEWFTLLAMVAVNYTSGLASSIYLPFYPAEAEKRGVPATEYGLVFGVYELVAFAVCLLYGKYMDRIGPKFLVIATIIISGICSILFGFLQLVTSHLIFVTMSMLLMMLESATTSAAYTASYAIVIILFPKNVATTVALLETFYGVGFALGPALGGYLYQVGGFMSSFDYLGLQFLVVGVFIYLALPKMEKAKGDQKKSVQLLPILKLKEVLVSLFTLLCSNLSIGYLLTTLEPHLRQFNLSPSTVGLMFALSTIVYILATPLVGWLCDSYVHPRKVMLAGSLLMFASFFVVGPFPFLPTDTELWMVCLGLVLHGLAMSCSVVPGFLDAIKSAVGCGLPDDPTTYCVVTAISTSAVALGEFIGPSLAGVMLDVVGFRRGTLLVLGLYLVLLSCLTWQMCAKKSSSGKGAINNSFSMTETTTAHAHCPDRPAMLSVDMEDKLQLSGVVTYGSAAEGKYRSE